MTTDGSPSAADAVANGGGVSSPHSRRRSLHSPWASVVRGDSEQNSSLSGGGGGAGAGASGGASSGPSSSPPVEEASAPDNSLIESSGSEPQPESSENNGDNNAGGSRRTAWSMRPNGIVRPVSVMGGTVSWPTLSDSARPGPRSLSDTSRPVSDGLAASLQAPILSQPPQRSANNNGGHVNHVNSAGNSTNPARTRSRNRGGGGGGGGGGGSSGTGPSQNTFNQPSLPVPPPRFPAFDLPYAMMPAALDHTVRGPRPIGGGVGASQSHSGNDHSSQRSNSRRGSNYGPRPRGDGQYHNSHVGRRDQDHRDVHPAGPPQFPPPHMGYMPPPLPPGASAFMAHPHMRVYPGQIGFDMASPFLYVPQMPPESFRPMPVVPSLPTMILPPANENPLTNMIVKQIDFYFSDDNLVKDSFLRSNMDDHGWVPVSLIASFRRVQHLTKDIPLILESLRYSMVVEVQGDNIRRRDDWSKWVLSAGVVNSDSGSRASSSVPENVLATSLRETSLDDDALVHTNGNVEARVSHPEITAGQLSEESTSQSGLGNGDDAEEHSSSL